MIRITVKKKKSKAGDIFEILFVRIGIDPSYKKIQKKKVPVEKHPWKQGRKSNQPNEIFPSLFYLLNNTTFMKVVERGAYG